MRTELLIVQDYGHARSLGAVRSRGEWALGGMAVLSLRSIRDGALRGRAYRAVFVALGVDLPAGVEFDASLALHFGRGL